MSDPKFNPFAAALSSAQKYVADDRGPGMHNTLVCENCGAAREAKDVSPSAKPADALVCRYCGKAFGAS